MLNRFWQYLAYNLFGFEREETLGETLHFKAFELFTVAYVVYWALEWGFYIQHIRGVIMPLGLAEHLDVSFTFKHGVSIVNGILLALGATLGFLRIWPRLSYTVAALTFNLHYAARFCLGEICHDSHFVGLSLLMLAVGMYFSDDARVRRRFAFGGSFFFIGLAYLSASLSKLVATGPGWGNGRHLWIWIGEKTVDSYSRFGEIYINPFQEAMLASLPLATLVLTCGMVTEACGVGLWFRKTRFVTGLLCMGMHVGIYFSMNIIFDMFIYQLFVMCMPWDVLIDRALRQREPTRLRRLALQLG